MGGASGADGGPRDTQGTGGAGGAPACNPDGGAMDAGSCKAVFNFEAPSGCGLYGASLTRNTDTPQNFDGFTRLYHTDVAACGSGGLAVDVDLNLTDRLGGEVVLPVTAALGSTFNGKTITLALKGSVAGGPNTKVTLYLITTRYEEVLRNILIPATYTTLSMSLPPPDAGALDSVIGIAVQVHNQSLELYSGTLYIDEIDLKPSAPDGGAPDVGAPDAPDAPMGDTRSGDAGDGGTSDVRDAAAG